MADIQSATAEIRRGKKEEKKERRRKPHGKNIMVCPIPYGDHKQSPKNVGVQRCRCGNG